MEEQCHLLGLPPEVRFAVWLLLELREVAALQQCCKSLFEEGTQDALWRPRCYRDFFSPTAPQSLSFALPRKVLQREQPLKSKGTKRTRVNSNEGCQALQCLPNVCLERFEKTWEFVYRMNAYGEADPTIREIGPLFMPIPTSAVDLRGEYWLFQIRKRTHLRLWAPKKHMSPFECFASEIQPRMFDKPERKRFTLLWTEMGHAWKQMDSEERTPYQDMSVLDGKRWERELTEWPRRRHKAKSHRVLPYGRFAGEWLNGRLDGYGVAIYSTGERYEGEWLHGKRSGWGIMWWPRRIIVGGKEMGSGATAWERYEGDWLNDERSGRGTKYGRHGKVCIARWKQDIVIEVISKENPESRQHSIEDLSLGLPQ